MKFFKDNPSCQIKGLSEIYQGIFGKKSNGFFIDVGACDGYSYSNTNMLAESGWYGLLFEPSLKHYQQCREYYKDNPRINIYNIAIGSYEGRGVIYTGNHAVSTLSKEFKELLENTEYGKDLYKDSEICNIFTLNMALARAGVLGTTLIDVLSIDVEGYELEVLKGFSFSLYRPTLVIIEAHEMYEWPDRLVLYPEINTTIETAGYTKIYCDEINNIYVNKFL